MPLGGFAPLPIRLGIGDEEGWSATQHARVCADLVAAKRTSPIAVLSVSVVTSSLTAVVEDYFWQQENTVAAPSVSVSAISGGWTVDVEFPGTASRLPGEDGRLLFSCSHAVATFNGTAVIDSVHGSAGGSSASIVIHNGSNVTGSFTLVVYGSARRIAIAIGDYAGSLTKKDDTTENPVPYAAQIYQDLQGQRGSAYTTKPRTLVHAENLAIARLMASAGFRLPDRMRNNIIGPAKSDEGLVYWERVLGLGRTPDETKDAFRKRAAIHARPSKGATFDNMSAEISELLGEAFIEITRNHDGLFQTPPATTYWPTINNGPTTFNIGGGPWLSERAQIIINAQHPGGVSDGEFNQMMNISLFQLVDVMLPVWCTAQWRIDGGTSPVWDEFLWDDGTQWDDLFDWNS